MGCFEGSGWAAVRSERNDAQRTSAEVIDVHVVEVLGTRPQNTHLHLRLEDGRDVVVVMRAFRPDLRAAPRPVGRPPARCGGREEADRVSVDWPAAAEADAHHVLEVSNRPLADG